MSKNTIQLLINCPSVRECIDRLIMVLESMPDGTTFTAEEEDIISKAFSILIQYAS